MSRGSLFAKSGSRCGYGGGFYDRFLAENGAEKIVKVGLCYDFQRFDNIEQKEHDNDRLYFHGK